MPSTIFKNKPHLVNAKINDIMASIAAMVEEAAYDLTPAPEDDDCPDDHMDAVLGLRIDIYNAIRKRL